MHKGIGKVFLILGSVVVCFIIWNVVLGGDGVFTSVYNKITERVNVESNSINGGSATVAPEWNESTLGSASELTIDD